VSSDRVRAGVFIVSGAGAARKRFGFGGAAMPKATMTFSEKNPVSSLNINR
jgi:hypothetical protein